MEMVYEMDIRILRRTSNELVIEVSGEDDTLGNLISKEAMRHPKVIYSTYRIPHPLQDKLEIVIRFQEGADPGEILSEIVENIYKVLEEFRREVNKKL